MAATPREKFDAAVNVIRGLPKNGSFQPSNEVMLKFYAFYKQATEGPCTAPKPGIWSVVNRRKWEAWAELGPMERETAMLRYVDELKNIVEIMPQTDQVAEFVDTLGSFYEVIHDSPGGSKVMKGSPVKVNGSPQVNGGGGGTKTNGHGEDDDSDDDNSEEEGKAAKDKKEADDVGDDDDDDEEEDDKKADSVAATVDSGSDGEEFCDTSELVDQRLQTSTPAGRRSESRVRFAPHVSMAEDSVISAGDLDLDLSTALKDMSVASSQMQGERLKLWSDSEFAFLPRQEELSARQATDSLHVNSSFSSQEDEDIVSPTTEVSLSAVECRGGGEGDGHTPRSSSGHSSRAQGSAGRSQQSRGANTSRGGGGERRALLAAGSGAGGHRGHGQGHRGSRSSVDEQILVTLLQLQQDLVSISQRLTALETCVTQHSKDQEKREKESKTWPFGGLSKKWVVLLLVWPVVTPVVINLLCRPRRSVPR